MLWQGIIISSPYSLSFLPSFLFPSLPLYLSLSPFLPSFLPFCFWTLFLKDTQFGAGAGQEGRHVNALGIADQTNEQHLGPWWHCWAATPKPIVLTPGFLLLRLKYAYGTFSGLLCAAKTIPSDKSTWTLNLQDAESPCLFPNLIIGSEKRQRVGVWSRETEGWIVLSILSSCPLQTSENGR